MPIVPEQKDAKVAFYASKTTGWATNAVAIGTTTAAVTDLTTKVTAAQDKIAAALAARKPPRTPPPMRTWRCATWRIAGAAIIQSIKAKAAISGDSSTSWREIPAPATPTPVPPPGTPTDFKAALNPDGSLKLTWKCPNPAQRARHDLPDRATPRRERNLCRADQRRHARADRPDRPRGHVERDLPHHRRPLDRQRPDRRVHRQLRRRRGRGDGGERGECAEARGLIEEKYEDVNEWRMEDGTRHCVHLRSAPSSILDPPFSSSLNPEPNPSLWTPPSPPSSRKAIRYRHKTAAPSEQVAPRR